jgi:predicted ester cyclase
MSTEDNKARVRYFIEMMNKENWAEQLRAEFPGDDTEALIEENMLFRTAFPDYQFTIDDLIAEGDKVVVRGTVRATHRDEFPVGELKGIAPTGKRLEWTEAWIHRFEAGKPAESWSIIDGVSRLQQLGVLPSPK